MPVINWSDDIALRYLYMVRFSLGLTVRNTMKITQVILYPVSTDNYCKCIIGFDVITETIIILNTIEAILDV